MKNLSKPTQQVTQDTYCGHCSVRIALAERPVIRHGIAYHRHCDAKLNKYRGKQQG